MSSAIGTLKIKIFDGKDHRVLSVPKSTATIGCAEHCDCVINHETVQPEHVRAWLEGGRIWIQDLGTSSGSFLNGIRLPHLKPMLVRDLDVLKLGECSVTVSLEPVLVRAPIIKAAHVPSNESTLTDIKPLPASDQELEKRREEVAKLSRELAEIKLQLQIGHLEKVSIEEMRKEVNYLRDERRHLTEEKAEALKAISHAVAERTALIRSTADQVAEMKRTAEREIEIKSIECERNRTQWRVELLHDLNQLTTELARQKGKSLSAKEWPSELSVLYERLLLQTEPGSSSSQAAAALEVSSEAIIPRAKTKRAKSLDFITHIGNVPVYVWGSVFAFVAVVSFLFLNRSPSRRSMSTHLASQSPLVVHQQKPLSVFKRSYTDNVLYSAGYLEVENNPEFRKRWIADLQRYRLAPIVLTAVIEKEAQLIQDLQKMKVEAKPQDKTLIPRMRSREQIFQNDLAKILSHQPLTSKQFPSLKRNFFARNQFSVE